MEATHLPFRSITIKFVRHQKEVFLFSKYAGADGDVNCLGMFSTNCMKLRDFRSRKKIENYNYEFLVISYAQRNDPIFMID